MISRGVTLIELLISLAIISIIFLFSTPLSPLLYKTNQAQVVANEIKNAMQYAKMQAVIRHDQVILTHLPESNDWSSGMVLLADKQILHEWHWHVANLSVRWHGFQSREYLLFATDINRSAMNGFFLIDTTTRQPIKLVINRLGRIKLC